MELIAKISKGSKMDQVYVPKNRSGFSIGSYVVLKLLETKKLVEKPFFYNIKSIEPIKLGIVNKIISIIDKTIDKYENIIITGSFLDRGFNFNDIDVIVVSEATLNIKSIQNMIEDRIRIKMHIMLLDNRTLIKGLSTDPLYEIMLSRCIAKKRFVYKIKHKINYKILDLHLLKSKTLIDNFDLLDGSEKYYLIRNMIAIFLYLQQKKIDKEKVDKEIIRIFDLKDIKEVKQNMLGKDIFLKKYKIIYKKIFNKIMEGIKHGSEQK